MKPNNQSWICCQLGAREHYAIPRALFRKEALRLLITDAWVQPLAFLAKVSSQRSDVRGRWHEELRDAPVVSFNWSLMGFELLARARGLTAWHKVMARNESFQRKAVSALRDYVTTRQQDNARLSAVSGQSSGGPFTLFSYSYAARDIFRLAKQRGWKTVLGQIDPGPMEEKIVAGEAARVPELAGKWQPAPQTYWNSWREECEMADRIIVNSEWSRTCLLEAGVNSEKLSVIPLAYEMSAVSLQPGGAYAPVGGQMSASGPERPTARREVRQGREYPPRFTRDRPLRVLFLGQVNLRKGAARLFDAIRSFKDEPIEFWFVGPVQVSIPSELQNNSRVRWFDVAARSEVDGFYRKADLLIFPTLSDGFGLTQLEAQARSLPIIASRFCGEVVRDGVNGIVLPELSPSALAAALRSCLRDPARLRGFAANALKQGSFDLNMLAESLLCLCQGHTDFQTGKSLSLNKQ